jgi:ubiquinol-cytochrome c reductase iron-sulfur subunit
MDDKMKSRRNFLAGCCVAMGAVAVGGTIIPALSALRMANDLQFSLTKKEVDLTDMKPGDVKIDAISLKRTTLIGDDELVVPVMIVKRRPEWVSATEKPAYAMKVPVDAKERYLKPQWFVARAFCSHLGCTPNVIDETTSPVHIVCPCHGGKYDTLGRALSGPPPSNLNLIPYNFITENRISIFIKSPADITRTKVSQFKAV